MKKIFTILMLSAFSLLGVNAQVCNIDNSYTEPGLYPVPDSLPCIVRSENTDITVQFVNFDSATYNGLRVKVEYLIIDTIMNLPCGIKWSTSAQDAATPHRFENQENGCIRFRGTTTDAEGQYKLYIKVRAKVNILPNPIGVSAESVGLRVDVRVIESVTDTCPAIDTTSGATLLSATCFSEPVIMGLSEISSINHFSFYPNPTNNIATVSFTADKPATYTARIINIYGAEVSREVLNVTSGLNMNSIDVANLANGVYIYTITDGKNVQTQRFVVEK